jgi:hypothetical protein
MSDPNWFFCDSRCILVRAEKLFLRSAMGEVDGENVRSITGDWGISTIRVMQSTIRTLFAGGGSIDPSDKISANVRYFLWMTSEMWRTL